MASYAEELNMDQSEILFQELNRSIVNIYKVCMEEMGYDLYTTENQVEYHNYLINNPIKLGVNGGWDGDFDIGSLSPSVFDVSGIPPKPADVIKRGVYTAQKLMSLMGINAMQACAIVGYFMKESSCDPKSYNVDEYTYKAKSYSSALGPDCGEGICQWSFVSTKERELKLIGVTPHGHPGTITGLTLDQQIEMYAKGCFGQGCLKYNIKSCTNFDNAVCCACIQGHGSGHAQTAFREANNDVNSPAYIEACKSKYGKGRQDLARARVWGEQTLRAMGGSVGGSRSSGNLSGLNLASVKNEKMRKVLSDVNHICLAHNYRNPSSWYCVRKSGANDKPQCPKGKCTYGPSTWYNNAGLDIHFYPNPSSANHSNTILGNYGFKMIWHGTAEAAKNLRNSQFAPGDVATMYVRTSEGNTAHGCMWTGKDWRSDFVQNSVWVYGSAPGRDGDYSVCIWRHPGFQ
jgi:hypothetical protein